MYELITAEESYWAPFGYPASGNTGARIRQQLCRQRYLLLISRTRIMLASCAVDWYTTIIVASMHLFYDLNAANQTMHLSRRIGSFGNMRLFAAAT